MPDLKNSVKTLNWSTFEVKSNEKEKFFGTKKGQRIRQDTIVSDLKFKK